MSSERPSSSDRHLAWVAMAAGATFYLFGLYRRLGDSKQAAHADRSGRAVQEQFHRMVVDASKRMALVVDELKNIERQSGDTVSEREGWTMAIHGLLPIAIWAGVADSMQDPPVQSSIAKKANRAIEAALEATKIAFPVDVRRELVGTISPIAVEESIEGLRSYLSGDCAVSEEIAAELQDQIRASAGRFLVPWME